jgi:hypothetical protein
LQDFVAYKAADVGIACLFGDPKYSSQDCSGKSRQEAKADAFTRRMLLFNRNRFALISWPRFVRPTR